MTPRSPPMRSRHEGVHRPSVRRVFGSPAARAALVLVAATLAAVVSPALAKSETCACLVNQTITRVVVMIDVGCTGSTWLGQLLQKHPCSHGFIQPHAWPDGHWRAQHPKNMANELRSWLGAQAGKGPHGALLWYKLANRVMHSGRFALQPTGPTVVLSWGRSCFSTAMCNYKKKAMVDAKKAGRLKCANPSQPGSGGCEGAKDFTFTMDPLEFDRQIRMAVLRMEELRNTSLAMASEYGARHFESNYTSLMCASQQAHNAIPKEILTAVGLPTDCVPELDTKAKKVTPASPGSMVRNLDEVLEWAQANGRTDWAYRFSHSENEGLCGFDPAPAAAWI